MIVCAIDTETTGLNNGLHEIVAVSCVAFELETFKLIEPKFEMMVKPLHPDRTDPKALEVNGLNLKELEKAAHPNIVSGRFQIWWENVLDGEKINPLAHNWGFDKGFLEAWLGEKFTTMFHYHFRDTQPTAQFLMDAGKLKTDSTSLVNLAGHFSIPHKPHEAYSDSMACLLLFKELLKLVN